MRYTIAVATLAAITSATEVTCDRWKESTYESKKETEGWTKQHHHESLFNDEHITYFDKNGNEITDWESFRGYVANCVLGNPFEGISPEMLELLYWTMGALLAIALVVVLYKCCKKKESDSKGNAKYSK